MTVKSLNQRVIQAKYAVRGALVARAAEIKAQLAAGKTFEDFDDIIFCNIGNPQALGLKPLEFPRQVLACVACPSLLDGNPAKFPPDAISRAETFLAATAKNSGIGAYTHSKGLDLVRQSIARFIEA